MKIPRKETAQMHETGAGKSRESIGRKIKKADVSHDLFKKELEKSFGPRPEEKPKNEERSAELIVDLLKVQIEEHLKYLAIEKPGALSCPPVL